MRLEETFRNFSSYFSFSASSCEEKSEQRKKYYMNGVEKRKMEMTMMMVMVKKIIGMRNSLRSVNFILKRLALCVEI